MVVRFPLSSRPCRDLSHSSHLSPTSQDQHWRDLHVNSPAHLSWLSLACTMHGWLCSTCSHSSCPASLSLPYMSLSCHNQPIAPAAHVWKTRLKKRVQTVKQLHCIWALNSHFPAKTRHWLYKQCSQRAQSPGRHLPPETHLEVGDLLGAQPLVFRMRCVGWEGQFLPSSDVLAEGLTMFSNSQTQAGGGRGPPSGWPWCSLFKVWLQAQFGCSSLCSKDKRQWQRDFLQVVKTADEDGVFNGYVYLLNRWCRVSQNHSIIWIGKRPSRWWGITPNIALPSLSSCPEARSLLHSPFTNRFY